MRYTAVGRPAEVRDALEAFAKQADADELIMTLPAPATEDRLRGLELVARELLG
jgi:alkanesulfonate monooxygenase SsuD/methylene tetrahydromethanopterin reductase-like flavin-dependent oxidoreductase (luciferase family)